MRRAYDPQRRQPKTIREYVKAHPEYAVETWSGIQIQGAGSTASLAMGMAANNGPDLFSAEVRHAVSQGLAYPLTEWIGQDGYLANGEPKLLPDGKPDLNGKIDADEAKWSGWMELPAQFRQTVTIDGKPWALPRGEGTYVGILFSPSRLERAGLDPMHPPQSWDEFVRWCRLLYNHDRGTPAVALPTASWVAAPFLATTGDSVIVQDRVSPETGKVYTFTEQELDLTAPDTGEDLSTAPVTWRCNVASPGGIALAELYHRLRWEPWIVDPNTGEPVGLTPEQATTGQVKVDGETIEFKPEDVITGCVIPPMEGFVINRLGRDVAMYPLYGSDLSEWGEVINPKDLGMMPFPPMTPEFKPALQLSIEYTVMGKDVVRRGGNSDAQHKGGRKRGRGRTYITFS